MRQNPVWTILCYLGAVWAVLLALVLAVSDLNPVAGVLIAIAGTALSSVVALSQWQDRVAPAQGSAGVAVPQAGARDAGQAPWLALDAIPLALLIIGRERDIRWSNAAARQMLEGELAGRPLSSVLRDPALTDAIEELWRTGANARQVGVTLGRGRELIADLGPIASGQGTLALLLLRDISGEKRLQTLRSDFIANVSHELKTPISALLGFIETLRGPASEDREASQRFLGIMQDQARRMDRLVADLLSLSRIELQEHAWPTDEVDLGQVLASVADSFALRLKENGMQLVLPARGRLPRVRGEADELVQLFQNLVENAIRYAKAGTPIVVEIGLSRDEARIRSRLPALREAEAMASITVRDQGAGIAREHLPRLTERFYRVDPARSRELGGTGLGLAIVKHILQRHRGSLSIESEPGKGSAFTVHLPI